MNTSAPRQAPCRRGRHLAVASLVFLLTGCTALQRVYVDAFYRPAELADGETAFDLPYRTGPGSDERKHRLDLYRPAGDGWPIMVFVHGGSLIKGDKAFEFGGRDIYGNIGRFYAMSGVGVAVINYRLQERGGAGDVRWTEQADDVAAALAWVIGNGRDYGGNGEVFLSGHSAGAWLAARVALDRERLASAGIEPEAISGVIAVSGSGYDMRDSRTWEMYRKEDLWAERFDPGIPGLDWHETASVVPLVDGQAGPRFLLIHTTREWRALGRQNRLLHEALQKAGIESELITLKSDNHHRMVLAMSRPDKPMSMRILEFIQGTSEREPVR